ncbi:glycosyltransferase [Pseudodesulfovibrio senegalensis]|jgi:hypothetical protein|nr:glycosyltransferase [Pseudodesulfovibrio senegalensis]
MTTMTMENPMTDGVLRSCWATLPEPVRRKLLLGCAGRMHLLEIGGLCLQAHDPALDAMACGLLQNAVAANPLDGNMAHQLLSGDRACAVLPPATLDVLRAVADNWRVPKNTGYYERLRSRRDFDKIRTFVEREAQKQPDNLYWREQALINGVVSASMDWTADMLAPVLADTGELDGLEPVRAALGTMFDRMHGRCASAQSLARRTGDAFGPAQGMMTAGLCLLDAGEREQAASLFLEALAHQPWNTSLILRTYDLVFGVGQERAPLDGDAVILLYSWNKDVELDATLRHLYSSDLGSARLVVLDNGSTDRTAEVLESWQLRFKPERMGIVTLPVNIGAPAARNWLMHLPEVQESDFVVYLDDDVELPRDWLTTLGAAVKRYPDAGVWGCKVVDHAQPLLMQHADGQLTLPDATGATTASLAPNPVKLSDLHVQSTDTGLFDYMRPCASVTGCCHLFRTERLLKTGDFSIHLSPSQYDDFEHDLRLCEAGMFPVYTGHLRVLHKKRSGAASRVSGPEEGNALGNRYKMQAMHARSDLHKAEQAGLALLEEDLQAKMRALDERIRA